MWRGAAVNQASEWKLKASEGLAELFECGRPESGMRWSTAGRLGNGSGREGRRDTVMERIGGRLSDYRAAWARSRLRFIDASPSLGPQT